MGCTTAPRHAACAVLFPAPLRRVPRTPRLFSPHSFDSSSQRRRAVCCARFSHFSHSRLDMRAHTQRAPHRPTRPLARTTAPRAPPLGRRHRRPRSHSALPPAHCRAFAADATRRRRHPRQPCSVIVSPNALRHAPPLAQAPPARANTALACPCACDGHTRCAAYAAALSSCVKLLTCQAPSLPPRWKSAVATSASSQRLP